MVHQEDFDYVAILQQRIRAAFPQSPVDGSFGMARSRRQRSLNVLFIIVKVIEGYRRFFPHTIDAAPSSFGLCAGFLLHRRATRRLTFAHEVVAGPGFRHMSFALWLKVVVRLRVGLGEPLTVDSPLL